MNNKQTELLNFIVNPAFLELMKQPVGSMTISPYLSFNIERSGRMLHFTFYDKDGQVNVSEIDKNGVMGNNILRDFCQTQNDFKNMLRELDDLLTRMPLWK